MILWACFLSSRPAGLAGGGAALYEGAELDEVIG